MFKIPCIFSLVLIKIIFLGTSLFAQRESELEPMVVVETRSPVPLSEASPWVTRISEEDFESRQIYNLADALRFVPGMTIVRSGQAGSQTSLFSRGANSDHVTFLYEGRKLNGGFSGTYNLGQVSLNGVSTLEVLRGASSVQYGAQGIGGAVMLRNSPTEKKSTLTMEGGSNNSLHGGLVLGFNESEWNGRVGTSFKTTNNEQPYSQFDNQSMSFHLSRRLSDGLEFDFVGTGSKSDLNYPGNNKSPSYPASGQYQDIQDLLLSPGLKLNIGDWKVSSFYSYSNDDLIGKDSFSNTTYEVDTNLFDLQLNGEVFEVIDLTVGGSYEEDSFFKKDNSSNLVDVDEENDSKSIFAISTFSASEKTFLTLGIRSDDFSDYGSASTWSSSLEHRLSEAVRFTARYATSFSPPQANDLYGLFGNPNLNSEKANSWEFGMNLKPNEIINLRLSYFETEFEDLIEWSGFTTSNVGEAKSKGFESALDAIFGNFTSTFTFSYLDAMNSTSNERLLRRPRIVGNLILQHSTQVKTIGVGLTWLHDTIDLDGSTFSRIKGEDYTVVRLYGDRQINESIKFFGRIENLLDEEYDEADGYPALGCQAYAGLRFIF